jgi:hypothetical protein
MPCAPKRFPWPVEARRPEDAMRQIGRTSLSTSLAMAKNCQKWRFSDPPRDPVHAARNRSNHFAFTMCRR